MAGKGYAPHLGLGYIAAVLLQNGHEVKILDPEILGISTEKKEKDLIKNLIKRFKPEMVGFTGTSHERTFVYRLAKFIKQTDDLSIIFGGPHATFRADGILKRIPEIDYIVRHEGEISIVKLFDTLENNKPLKKIQGISYRDGNRIIHNPERPFISDLDTIPFPARHLFHLKLYQTILPGIKENITNIISSRGCPFDCNFCSTTLMWGKNVRYRSRIVRTVLFFRATGT